MARFYINVFEQIISLENLFCAWENFVHNKRKRKDVQHFNFNLEENILKLHNDLKNMVYRHDSYKPFYIQDPKQRLIHKATVRDRIVHHAIFSILNPIFEPTFIANSFSCRIGKGTHKGMNTLAKILRKVSKNGICTCFVLKCDIKKFFDSIDHEILLHILGKRIKDEKAMWLLEELIKSYSVSNEREGGRHPGLPIGNLTSQLFANVYLNEFDQFVKHQLKIKYYIRYTDDFVIVSKNKKYLQDLVTPTSCFLKSNLKLFLHPNKLTIRKYRQGIDFLGYILFPYYKLVRTKTKRRIIKNLEEDFSAYKKGKLSEKALKQIKASYLGVLSHANSYKLRSYLETEFHI